MPAIENLALDVEPVDGRAGMRLVRVSYDLVTDEAEPEWTEPFVEKVLVEAIDRHDAPIDPASEPILAMGAAVTLSGAITRRSVERLIHRHRLDVEQDWWSTGHGGEVEPIAEWPDHLVARITLQSAGKIVDEASSPVVSGSWGALGSD